jgi:hypothetical protein
MTTIHIKPQHNEHFPRTHYDSLYEENSGWIIKPGEVTPFLRISEEKGNHVIDVHIPGLPAEQIEISDRDDFTEQITHLGPHDEIVHIIIPKTKQKKSVQSPQIATH